MNKPVVEVETTINASADTVWKALTAKHSALFPGSTIETDWRPGHKLTLNGEWQGKTFTDYGEIETAEPERELSFTHWSKTKERPENYHVVRTQLTANGTRTHVTLAQINRGPESEVDDKTKAEFKKNWTMMLDSLKKAAEAA